MEASLVLGYDRSLDWSPDGKFLAVSDDQPEQPRTGLLLLSVETGEKKQITLPNTDFLDLGAAFSPDGRTLAFTRSVGDFSGADIYSVPVQGGEAKRLTTDQGIKCKQYGVRTAGKSFLLSDGGLYRISVDGGKATPLAEGGQFVSFPPSQGKEIVLFTASKVTRRTSGELICLDQEVKAASATRLISSSQQEDTPDFSPDGKKIAFSFHSFRKYRRSGSVIATVVILCS